MIDPKRSTAPRVYVALASYNGMPWITRQVASILDQEEVEISLVVSDDGSSDGTVEWLAELAERDPRVVLLPPRGGEPGVGQNFLHLIAHLNPRPGEFVALSDQDDLWHRRKLRDQIDYMLSQGAGATSSNVLAFNGGPGGRGRSRVIRKDQPQQRWDFIFEAPGPGSTFVLDFTTFRVVRRGLGLLDQDRVWLHDWVIYALVRAADVTWAIDSRPHVAYRQHGDNTLGENRGLNAVKRRLGNLRNGLYQEQFLLVARASRAQGALAGRDQRWLDQLDRLIAILGDDSPLGRLRLWRYVGSIRRRRLDGINLVLLRTIGIW